MAGAASDVQDAFSALRRQQRQQVGAELPNETMLGIVEVGIPVRWPFRLRLTHRLTHWFPFLFRRERSLISPHAHSRDSPTRSRPGGKSRTRIAPPTKRRKPQSPCAECLCPRRPPRNRTASRRS